MTFKLTPLSKIGDFTEDEILDSDILDNYYFDELESALNQFNGEEYE